MLSLVGIQKFSFEHHSGFIHLNNYLITNLIYNFIYTVYCGKLRSKKGIQFQKFCEPATGSTYPKNNQSFAQCSRIFYQFFDPYLNPIFLKMDFGGGHQRQTQGRLVSDSMKGWNLESKI